MHKTTEELFNILDQMFDLPNNITAIYLSLEIDAAPELIVTYYPDVKNNNLVTKKFRIEEIDD